MTTKARPTTRKLAVSERATMVSAREAIAKGKSIKGVAFLAAGSKAAKAEYLRAHL